MSSIQVHTPPHLPDLGDLADWCAAGLALSPAALRAASTDRRWQTRWLVARDGDTVVGVIASYQPKTATSDSVFDPRVVAAQACAQFPPDARTWAYVGGYRDLLSGATVSARLPPAERAAVRRALVAEAWADAHRSGHHAVALFVRDDDIEAFRAALGPACVESETRSHAVVAVTWHAADGYLAALDRKRRYRVRQEWERLDELGLRAVEEPARALVAEAAPLIAANKARYGVTDHPRLVELRLREWADRSVDDVRAVHVRTADGGLAGAAFLARHGTDVELYELGIRDDAEHRHLVYAELLMYAPLRYTERHGATRLKLGLDSPEPKRLRGAAIRPVWTVTTTAPGPGAG